MRKNYVNVYLWPRYKVALDGHASSKTVCKSYLKVRCLSMLKVCGGGKNKVSCAVAHRFSHTLVNTKFRSLAAFSLYASLFVVCQGFNLYHTFHDSINHYITLSNLLGSFHIVESWL